MNDRRVEVIACTAEDIFAERCEACLKPLAPLEFRVDHERHCVQMRDLLIDEKLYAQAIDDGRVDDATEIAESRDW